MSVAAFLCLVSTTCSKWFIVLHMYMYRDMHMCAISHCTACVDVGVRAVVYTSTFNVVFGGQEIREGREDTLPYFPLHKVRSKSRY